MDLRLGAAPAACAPPKGEHQLCFSWERYESLRELGCAGRASAWDDHFPDVPEDEVLADTESLAESWRFRDGSDYTEFDGVSLGRCWRWLLWLQTVPAYRFVRSMLSAVEHHQPRRVVCEAGVPETFRALLRELARGASWTLSEEPGGAWTAPLATEWTRPRADQGPLKRAAYAALDAWGAMVGGGRPPLLLSYYRPFERAARLMARRSYPLRLFCVDAPPRSLLPALALSGGGLFTRTEPPGSLGAAGHAALEAVRAGWVRARADARLFTWSGVSLAPALEPAVSALMGAPAEELARGVRRARRLWAEEKPAGVLVAYEEPPYQMMLAEVARQNGTPCAHLVHGLPDRHRVPFGRNSSSHLVFWGPAQRDGYARRGCLEGRSALVLGNPAFDGLEAAPPPRSVRRVLALTAPASPAVWTESDFGPQRHAEGLLRAFADFPELELRLRLHPSEPRAYYERLRAVREGRAILERGGSFADSARQADLVVGPFSTALVEAMLLGRPVLVLRWTRTPYDAPFDGHWGIAPLESPEVLCERLAALRDRPEAEITRILAAYPRVLDAFVGPRDGRASERLAATMVALAQPSPE